MKTKVKILFSTALVSGTLLLGAGAHAQGATDTRDVVHDTNGHIVVNTFGNCVRTKWEMGMDACGPEAPPPPPPAPVAHVKEDSRSYLVFFDFDKYNLTADAMEVLNNLFANTHNARAVQYSVTGHADRSGSDAYNMKLSERRAKAVQQQLQNMGAPGTVSVDWKGEREPLVPTDDGIKEPQNRRAEIRVRTEVLQ